MIHLHVPYYYYADDWSYLKRDSEATLVVARALEQRKPPLWETREHRRERLSTHKAWYE